MRLLIEHEGNLYEVADDVEKLHLNLLHTATVLLSALANLISGLTLKERQMRATKVRPKKKRQLMEFLYRCSGCNTVYSQEEMEDSGGICVKYAMGRCSTGDIVDNN